MYMCTKHAHVYSTCMCIIDIRTGNRIGNTSHELILCLIYMFALSHSVSYPTHKYKWQSIWSEIFKQLLIDVEKSKRSGSAGNCGIVTVYMDSLVYLVDVVRQSAQKVSFSSLQLFTNLPVHAIKYGVGYSIVKEKMSYRVYLTSSRETCVEPDLSCTLSDWTEYKQENSHTQSQHH